MRQIDKRRVGIAPHWRIVTFALGLLLAASASRAAEPPCGCLFVEPLPPRGVSVIRGEVTLSNPVPRVVYLGDILLIQGSPDAKLVCQARGTNGRAQQRVVSVPRVPDRQPVVCETDRPGADLLPTLPDFNRHRLDPRLQSSAPTRLIISPREGAIQRPRPAFDFVLPPNDEGWRLKLSGEDGLVFDKAIGQVGPGGQTTFAFPAEASPLRQGRNYKLEIVAAGGDTAWTDETRFTVLPAAEAAALKTSIDGINRLSIDDVSKRLLRAAQLGARHLYSDAISELSSSEQAQKDPEALRLLGDLHQLSASGRAAEAAYLRALEPDVVSLDSVCGQASSWESLGVVRESLANSEAAIANYREAQERYRSSSCRDVGGVSRVQESLRRLQRQ